MKETIRILCRLLILAGLIVLFTKRVINVDTAVISYLIYLVVVRLDNIDLKI